MNCSEDAAVACPVCALIGVSHEVESDCPYRGHQDSTQSAAGNTSGNLKALHFGNQVRTHHIEAHDNLPLLVDE